MVTPFLTFLLGVLVCFIAGQCWRCNTNRQQKYKITNEHEYSQRIRKRRRRLDFTCNKEGKVWLLESEKIHEQTHKKSEDLKRKEVLQVFPVKKYAILQDHSLILSDDDGSNATTIQLLDCSVVAVSASNLPSRKWDKRYPIRVESENLILNSTSKMCYLYLDTCSEKESWCKELRLASCHGPEKLDWYLELREEYKQYLASSTASPANNKPPTILAEVSNKNNKMSMPFKALLSLKKIPKKISSFAYLEKRNDKIVAPDDMPPANVLMNSRPNKFPAKNILPIITDKIPDEASISEGSSDEGTCWNLLIARLFFDARRSMEINCLIKELVSAMRTPDHIKIACTGLEFGDLSPKIHNVKNLPSDESELWAVEFDIKYFGEIVLDIDISLAKQSELQSIDTSEGLNSSADTTKSSNESIDDGLVQLMSRSNWASTLISAWKAITNSTPDQDSQVKVSLVLNVESIQGTMRLYIQPPPSNQLWYGFTSMPKLVWYLKPLRDIQEIISNDIMRLIDNVIKETILDNMVLPNTECVTIPWMLSDNDDWVPQNAAPFIWINEEIKDSDSSDNDRQKVDNDYMDDREKETDIIQTFFDSQTNPHRPFETIPSVMQASEINKSKRSDSSIFDDSLTNASWFQQEFNSTIENQSQSEVESSITGTPSEEIKSTNSMSQKGSKLGNLKPRMLDYRKMGGALSMKVEEKKRQASNLIKNMRKN